MCRQECEREKKDKNSSFKESGKDPFAIERDFSGLVGFAERMMSIERVFLQNQL